ncbi:MAG: hypothetical protein Q7S40_16065 [Opitutaceae bacterium]|nr:hypothetical protein [Opitutaceae bacterium]
MLSIAAAERWIPANDSVAVQRTGAWTWTGHRYAADQALVTSEDGAALEVEFSGAALVLCLDTLTPPNYGRPELGRLEVLVNGTRVQTVYPRAEGGDVVIARADDATRRRIRIVHRKDDSGSGARIRGFRVLDAPTGELAVVVSGEHNGGLVDVRAVLSRQGRVVRDTLVRNWLTGQCRLAGIPPADDYTLELRAFGWKTARRQHVSIVAGRETQLPPVYVEREWNLRADAFKFPGFGRPAVRLRAQSFRARFEAYRAEIRGVRIVRRTGPAVISRGCAFEEDRAAGYYYHREGTVTLPADTPAGWYDLEISITDGRGERRIVSPRSVHVVERFAADPVLLAFGHLDTWGQYQAEYLSRLVKLANVIAPDVVLVSNAANPAYVAGALSGLEMPFVANFGNHRSPEPGPWFGEPLGMVDFGAEFCVLNFGRAWDSGFADADVLLTSRGGARIKIINAFEPNAPVSFLDRHHVVLIHDAHGPGPTVNKIGATPTVRVGKANSESFRVIRFRDGRPVSYTYGGHASAPIPFPRGGVAPVRVRYEPVNDGSHSPVTARWENDLEEGIPNARLVFVLPRGTYETADGRIEQAVESDDARLTVISVRCDFGPKSRGTVTMRPKR